MIQNPTVKEAKGTSLCFFDTINIDLIGGIIYERGKGSCE
jgi:hypothetical protein